VSLSLSLSRSDYTKHEQRARSDEPPWCPYIIIVPRERLEKSKQARDAEQQEQRCLRTYQK